LQTLTPPNDDAQTLESQRFRSHVGQISRQSGLFFAGTIFTAALSYFFKIYLARVLGPESLGLYALGFTLVGFLGIFNALGLPDAAVRFVAQYSVARQFEHLHALLWRGAATLLAANVVFAVLLLLAGPWVAVHFYHSAALAHFIPWFAALMLLGVLAHFYAKVLAGYQDINRRTLIVSFIGSPLNIAIAVLLITLGFGLRGYLAAQVLSATVVLFLLFQSVRRLTPPQARFRSQPGRPLQREVVSFSYTLVGISLMEFVIAQVDKISLGYFRGAREVGIYSIAAAFVAYVPILLSSVNQLFSPMVSGLHTLGDRVMLKRLFQALTKWVVALTLPLAISVMVFSRVIMHIFGAGFESGWPILVIGTLGQLVNCGVGSVGLLLLMSGHEKRLIRVQIYMAFVMLALSLALVPVWGLVGAGMASALTTIGMNLWNLIEVRRAMGIHPYNRSYFKLLPATAAAVAVAFAVLHYSSVFSHNWLTAAVGLLAAYLAFATIIFASGLDDDDTLIAHALRRRVSALFGRAVPEGAQ